MNSKILAGKTAIITGTASGIGKTTAQLFAQKGAKVILLDITAMGEQVAAALREEGCWAKFKLCDVCKAELVKEAVEFAIAETGQLDILVNVAGIVDTLGSAETDEEVFDRVISVNLKGVFLTMKYSIPHMMEKGGSIVNVSSVSSIIFRSSGIGDAYSASKGGVNALTNSAAIKYSKYGIRCNAILPGAIETPMNTEAYKEWDPRVPIRRLGKPEDIANAALFLASDASSFITAVGIPVAGGAQAAQAKSKRRKKNERIILHGWNT